jgi:hypothetical protein
MRHSLSFLTFFGVVCALAVLDICPGVEISVGIASRLLLKQSRRCEKVWSSFALDKIHGSRLHWWSSNSITGASIGRIDGARGVLSVHPASMSWRGIAFFSGEALVPREFANGDGVWHLSSSSLIESTGELCSRNDLASLSLWLELKLDVIEDAGWCLLLEIPQPSYRASNSQREGEFLYQFRMSWLHIVQVSIRTRILVSAVDYGNLLAFW